MNGAIEPTVTQQVRSFMVEQGVDIKPWTGLDETYGELYLLLNRRRDDPDFWPPLAALLQRVVDGAVNPDRPGRLPAPQAELLASWDMELLMEDLRAALPGGEPPRDPSAVRRFASRLSSAVMGGFLLLGLASASGCPATPKVNSGTPIKSRAEPKDDVKAPAPPADNEAKPDAKQQPDPAAWFHKCDLEKSSVLWGTIHKSGLDRQKKQQLCSCFDSLNKSWADGLTRLFSSGSAKDIARSLEFMVSCCAPDKKGCLDQDYDKVKRRFIKRRIRVAPVPVYKGVSFPETKAEAESVDEDVRTDRDWR